MTNINDDERAFYVVQFKHLPFDGIDNYVVVRNTWLILSKPADKSMMGPMAAVTYPNTEDASITKESVKRKDKYNKEWDWYVAIVKYKSGELE